MILNKLKRSCQKIKKKILFGLVGLGGSIIFIILLILNYLSHINV